MENSSNLFDKKGNKISLPQNGERIIVIFKKQKHVIHGPDLARKGNLMINALGENDVPYGAPLSVSAEKCVLKNQDLQ